jgi:hypothetical protein
MMHILVMLVHTCPLAVHNDAFGLIGLESIMKTIYSGIENRS